MGPRANFSCRKCGTGSAKKSSVGEPAVIEDLPINTMCCPLCGSKRGFSRLFDSINVSAEQHARAKIVDTHVQPMWEHHHEITESAKRHNRLAEKSVEGQMNSLGIPISQLVQMGNPARSRRDNYALIQRLRPPIPLTSASHNSPLIRGK